MFALDYIIDQEQKDELKKVASFDKFIDEVEDIVGRIQLVFNNRVEGILDEDIPNIQELLTIWFRRLNEVAIYCNNNSYAAMKIPESFDVWLEFTLTDEVIHVKEVRVVQEKTENFVVNNLIEIQEVLWEEVIEAQAFYQCIFTKTKQFLVEVQLINPILMKSTEIMAIEALYIQAKDIN